MTLSKNPFASWLQTQGLPTTKPTDLQPQEGRLLWHDGKRLYFDTQMTTEAILPLSTGVPKNIAHTLLGRSLNLTANCAYANRRQLAWFSGPPFPGKRWQHFLLKTLLRKQSWLFGSSITKTVKGGYYVSFGNYLGFIPRSHLLPGRTSYKIWRKRLESVYTRELPLKVLRVKRMLGQGARWDGNIVFSRAEALAQFHRQRGKTRVPALSREQWRALWQSLETPRELNAPRLEMERFLEKYHYRMTRLSYQARAHSWRRRRGYMRSSRHTSRPLLVKKRSFSS